MTMKKIILLLLLINICSADQYKRPRGSSAFYFKDSIGYPKIEKYDNEEILCVYKKDDLIVKIGSAFGGAVKYPLYIDLFVDDKEMVILLELQPPLGCFLRQRYTKGENQEWVLVSENPIEKIGTMKRGKLVTATASSDEIIFYYVDEEYTVEFGALDKTKRYIKKVYSFTPWSDEDKIIFEQKPKGLLLEVLGDKVTTDNSHYDFRATKE